MCRRECQILLAFAVDKGIFEVYAEQSDRVDVFQCTDYLPVMYKASE